MKIVIHTEDGDALFKSINKKIKEGDLKTWEISLNTKDEILYNHIPKQWSEKVLLKPRDHSHGLQILTSHWSKNPEPDEAIKGYIIGRFVEILMVHFRKGFSKLEIL